MKADYSERAGRTLLTLPLNIRGAFFKQVQFLEQNLRHPSLRAKKYAESQDLWQARVTEITNRATTPTKALRIALLHCPAAITTANRSSLVAIVAETRERRRKDPERDAYLFIPFVLPRHRGFKPVVEFRSEARFRLAAWIL